MKDNKEEIVEKKEHSIDPGTRNWFSKDWWKLGCILLLITLCLSCFKK